MSARTVVFDVNETLSDQSLFGRRLAEVGAPESLAETWYAATLRDGIALAVAGTSAPYADVARAVLRALLHGVFDSPAWIDTATEAVLAGFDELEVHADVVPGVRALRRAGHRLATLSNGATKVAAGLFERAGLAGDFDRLLSAEDAGAWKPHPRSYRYAADQLDLPANELVLVAVHPWDLDGASRAGLTTVFLDRTGAPWPGMFTPPDHRIHALVELATVLDGSGRKDT